MNTNDLRMIRRCMHCIMPEVPDRISLDERGICNICNSRNMEHLAVKKKSEEDLSNFKKKILFYAKGDSKYDCAVSVSGGKDSMMTLYIAKKILNLRVLAIFVDNGFALPEMYHNVNRAAEILDIDLIIYKTNDFMDIFRKCLLSKKEVYYCRLCHILLEYIVKKICTQNDIKIILGGYTKGQQYIQNNELFWIYKKSDANVIKIFEDDEKYAELVEIFENPMVFMNKKFGNILQLSPFRYIDWDEKEIVEKLKKELDFQTSAQSWPQNSSNCMFNYVAQYKALEYFGYSQHETELSDLVRNKEMTRERALDIICTPLKEEHIVSALSKLNLTIAEL
ncbi:MAG: phosphoadenosine phosphosulfate reductase family protein [Fusobacterium necrophorum]|nr:phosphoadenosine phosphosulfate reductase family protein [Fusobacterium necrophorum]